MKKLLLLNGGHSEICLIEEAKKLGYYVITSGNKPDLIGHRYADEYIMGDYSNKENMLEIALKNKVEAVVSSANDFGAISAAYVAEKMGLPGHDPYETALLLHRKDLFKQFSKENNLQSPVSDIFDNMKDAILKKMDYNYPLIVKPADLTGGKGVSKINNFGEFEDAVEKAMKRSREHKVVIEEFIEGTYHSFSTFIVNKKVIAWFSDNEYSNVYPYFVDTSAGPADNVENVKNILIEQVEKVAGHLNLVDGVFHMQYVMDKNGKPYIFDITRRCSGDIYPEPVQHATGIPWAKWIVMSECGYAADNFVYHGKQEKFCGRHCIMADREGTVKDVIIHDEIKENIYDSLVWWQVGDIVYNHTIDKQGILFLEYSSREEMIEKVKNIKKYVEVIVK